MAILFDYYSACRMFENAKKEDTTLLFRLMFGVADEIGFLGHNIMMLYINTLSFLYQIKIIHI